MDIKPQFVNGDMFLAYTGMNLSDKLRENDNNSNRVDTFLFRVERRLMAWIDKHTFRTIPYNKLTPFQLENFQLAILEQAMYMWRNGDIALDSGYDQETGVKIDPSIKSELVVCEPCIDFLQNAGLFNLKIKNRKRFTRNLGMGYGSEGGVPRNETN